MVTLKIKDEVKSSNCAAYAHKLLKFHFRFLWQWQHPWLSYRPQWMGTMFLIYVQRKKDKTETCTHSKMILYYSVTSGSISIIHYDFRKWMRLNCLLLYACLFCVEWHTHSFAFLSFIWLTKFLVCYMLCDHTNFSESEGFTALCRIRPLY